MGVAHRALLEAHSPEVKSAASFLSKAHPSLVVRQSAPFFGTELSEDHLCLCLGSLVFCIWH